MKKQNSSATFLRMFITMQTVMSSILAVLSLIIFIYHGIFNENVELIPSILLGLIASVCCWMFRESIKESKNKFNSNK